MAASHAHGALDRRLQQIGVELREYLRRRYRLLAAEHDDLLQQAIVDLFEATRHTHDHLPDDELTALAHSILKRRIVDRFRRETRNVVDNIEPGVVPDPHDEDSFDARMHYRRLLRAVLLLVDRLNTQQQALLLDDEIPGDTLGAARSPAQRQQLRRLRQLLRTQLANEFGIRIDDQLLAK